VEFVAVIKSLVGTRGNWLLFRMEVKGVYREVVNIKEGTEECSCKEEYYWQ